MSSRATPPSSALRAASHAAGGGDGRSRRLPCSRPREQLGRDVCTGRCVRRRGPHGGRDKSGGARGAEKHREQSPTLRGGGEPLMPHGGGGKEARRGRAASLGRGRTARNPSFKGTVRSPNEKCANLLENLQAPGQRAPGEQGVRVSD